MTVGGGRKVLRGIAASQGVAVGKAALWSLSGVSVPRRHIDPDLAEAEVQRLQRAIDASRGEIEGLRTNLTDAAGAKYGLILDAHMLMHRDELIVDATIRAIREEHKCAEWALSTTVSALREQLAGAESGYFRERAQEVDHVGSHILRWLGGSSSVLPPMPGPRIIVAQDVSPADAARLIDQPVLALVTNMGSATSHTAILARALDIPTVVGVDGVSEWVGDGDVLVVDGLRGEVIWGADEQERERATQRGDRYRHFTAGLRKGKAKATTRDGVRVALYANIELPVEAALAVEAESEGVGLYRTEFLFLDRVRAPTEEEQYEVYADVIKVMAPRPVTFRTFDLGGDKLPRGERLPRTPNPALGLRAVRLSLARPDMLRAQLRAILRASAHGPARLMIPLVSTLAELRQVKELLSKARAELDAERVPCGELPVGIMVEVPSAAILADALAGECEFFSVGTNDLTQYTLALDRNNPQVAHMASGLEPAVLRLADQTARAALGHDIGLALCGDLASDPVALPIVVGLGYRELSMPCAATPLVREVISRIDSGLARRTATEALACVDEHSVRALVARDFSDVLQELWVEQGIELPV